MWYVMKIVFVLSLILSVFSSPDSPSLHGFPITEGENIPIERAPYHASLLYYGWIFLCSGIIVSEKVVLTAAHCSRGNPSQWLVQIGSDNKDEGGEKIAVDKFIIHDNYYNNDYDYNVCLFIMSNKMNLNGITTAAIPIVPPHYQIPDDLNEGFASAWGSSSNESITDLLKGINYPIIHHKECEKMYADHKTIKITKNVLCAGITEEFCEGDSGAPLTVECFLVGMASYGAGCAGTGLPGIWIKMTSVGPWINEWIEDLEK